MANTMGGICDRSKGYFCPKCNGDLISTDHSMQYHCTGCGYHFAELYIRGFVDCYRKFIINHKAQCFDEVVTPECTTKAHHLKSRLYRLAEPGEELEVLDRFVHTKVRTKTNHDISWKVGLTGQMSQYDIRIDGHPVAVNKLVRDFNLLLNSGAIYMKEED